jgi:hypothetical protein
MNHLPYEDWLVDNSLVTPQPGFTKRWQATLAKKRAARQRRNAWLVGGFCLVIALIGLGILYFPLLANLSPGVLLTNVLFTATTLLVKANQAREIVEVLLSGVSPVFPLAVWVLGATGFCLLSLAWVVTMWKIIVPKGVRS